jgi:hypothetical protein
MPKNIHLWMRASVALVAAAAAALALSACSPAPKAAPTVLSDKVYSVTPSALKVKSGIVSGEVTEMKIVEQREADGTVATPAKLTGKLVLKNISADQSVRFLTGSIVYIDMQGKPIVLEDNRTEPLLKLSSGYSGNERLDPGQDTAQAVEAEFPAEALKAKRLKDIRIDLTYIPSSFRKETLSLPVSIGGQ